MQENKLMKTFGLTIIGDSIVRNKKKGVIYDWTKNLNKKIFKKTKVKLFIKKIVHGMNSRGLLNILPDFLNKINQNFKDMIIFQIGINDSWYYKSLKGYACVLLKEFKKFK